MLYIEVEEDDRDRCKHIQEDALGDARVEGPPAYACKVNLVVENGKIIKFSFMSRRTSKGFACARREEKQRRKTGSTCVEGQ